mmetsp:Transcript_27502/g.53824  ORF Transcript_27502/g.53824 Transcript_27502/m.53824 type:complete len:84 (+) Transcript_27502:248-499(+)
MAVLPANNPLSCLTHKNNFRQSKRGYSKAAAGDAPVGRSNRCRNRVYSILPQPPTTRLLPSSEGTEFQHTAAAAYITTLTYCS